jgi:hypothetical protein
MEERMDVVMNNIPLICTLVGVAGVVFAIILAGIVKGAPAGNEKMQAIAGAIQEGAIAYLNRQLKSMGIAGIIIFGVIFATMGAKTAFGFLLGAWPPLWPAISACGFPFWPTCGRLKPLKRAWPPVFPWPSRAAPSPV